MEKRPWSLRGWASRNKPHGCGVVKKVQGYRKALDEVRMGHRSCKGPSVLCGEGSPQAWWGQGIVEALYQQLRRAGSG